LAILFAGGAPSVGVAQSTGYRWKVHDPERPRPRVVTPGRAASEPPGDAVVLFDGRSLDGWRADNGAPARWTVRDGYMQTVPGAGAVTSARAFGDMQLHLEWATPAPPVGSGQDRGNSGVIIMGRYEVQILDSHDNTTYADGQAAAIYGQHPPLVNASRPAGEWQSYDIVFRRPRWTRGGSLLSPARMTVFHNGVLVQDNAELWGGTNWLQFTPYEPHADSLPLTLQDHDHPVRYRNIWVRPLPDLPTDERGPLTSRPRIALTPAALDQFVGTYANGERHVATITRSGSRLFIALAAGSRPLELVPQSRTRFDFARTAGTVEFITSENAPTRITLSVAGVERSAPRRP
jgi:Domain of Unknown Function (DUF1080)